MPFPDLIRTAFAQVFAHKLRSSLTMLVIAVSVAFLIAVVAIIQGMNAYVGDTFAAVVIGSNSFQVRRVPLRYGPLFTDDEWRRIRTRPLIKPRDAEAVRSALPTARAISLHSGWPAPHTDVLWRDREISDVFIFGATPEYQTVQDYTFSEGRPLTEIDLRQRRYVAVIGPDVVQGLFPEVDPIGQQIRILGVPFTVIGVTGRKGRVFGRSYDNFVLLPLTSFEMLYGRWRATTISVKVSETSELEPAMLRAEEAMRVARGLRPGEPNSFSVETADALVAFWNRLTSVLFNALPTVVAIGVLVGGMVIMNIMLVTVGERRREIGIRRAVGAPSAAILGQFLAESTILSLTGSALGFVGGAATAWLVSITSPLPARIQLWSLGLALAMGVGAGLLFGVYPASRAARVDPIRTLRDE